MKKNWKVIDTIKDEYGKEYIVEYSADVGQYRITEFRDYHYCDEFIFDAREYNALNEIYDVYKDWVDKGRDGSKIGDTFFKIEDAIQKWRQE